MKFETTPAGITLPKIGFGTWKIGGGMSPVHSEDARSLSALEAALDCGYTHFDTAEMYAGGHSEELMATAFANKGINRNAIFITSKVHPSNLRYRDLITACENSLQRLNTEYLDLYLIHWPGSVPLHESFKALNELQEKGQIHNIGVSNFNLSMLQEAQQLCKTPILTNQVPYSLANRRYVSNGVLDYCQAEGIFFTAYSPVDEGRLSINTHLENIAQKHKVTPYQVAIAWLIQQKYVITIPMSMNPIHIQENFDAHNIALGENDLKLLN